MAGVRFNTDPRSTVHHSRASGNPGKQFVATATPLIREVETTIRDNPDIDKVWLNSHIYAILISCWRAILSGMRPRTWKTGKNMGFHLLQAQHAFIDKSRVIAEDLAHSQEEKRYYCFDLNQQKTGIITVRFTYRNGRIRIIGAGYWRKGKKIYEQANSIHR